MQNRPSIEELRIELNDLELIDEFAEGSYKTVYRVNVNSRIEALKVLYVPEIKGDDNLVQQENYIKRINREFKLLESLQSPYVVKLGSIKQRTIKLSNRKYLIYSEELVGGNPLDKMISEKYIPTMKEAAQLLFCGLDVIKEIWTYKTIHRDIKPGNIMFTGNKTRPYVILDFGIAFIIGDTLLTLVGNTPCTPAYIAPEMLKSGFRDNIDFRVDMFSLGVTAYEFTSGVHPFIKDNQYNTFKSIAEDNAKPLTELREDLPHEFCLLIDQLLKKKSSLRPNINILINKMKDFL